jgi:hypothetical protein
MHVGLERLSKVEAETFVGPQNQSAQNARFTNKTQRRPLSFPAFPACVALVLILVLE